MSTELKTGSKSRPLPSAREVRGSNLEAKHARERLAHSYLEYVADFIRDALSNFWAETLGKPVVNLTLSSPECPSEIRLRIDDTGRTVDVTSEPHL